MPHGFGPATAERRPPAPALHHGFCDSFDLAVSLWLQVCKQFLFWGLKYITITTAIWNSRVWVLRLSSAVVEEHGFGLRFEGAWGLEGGCSGHGGAITCSISFSFILF